MTAASESATSDADVEAADRAHELILEESEDRTEHPEETGAVSSQTIPEIPPADGLAET
jgi:hypothetical protein